MRKFPYVLLEYDEINSALYKPINSTHRIKYTCFHVSPGYLVLGSTSGSIYMFSRDPCSFLHLIPLSEGAVSCVLVSPDERLIALSTVRGIVCLISLKPSPKLIAVSMERVNERVDCLCWNDDSSEVYVGDWNGKISVMVLSIFTVNGMFQAPSCTVLMNLDSPIVQLSFSSPLLLVSTLTRCYICDTVEERYKRVGNKTRNGEFGGCFYEPRLVPDSTGGGGGGTEEAVRKEEKLVGRKRSFNFVPEDNGNVRIENVPRIFCARPGSRLWEVSANGVVMKTHQFKEALAAVPPAKVCRSNLRKSFCVERSEEIWTPRSLDFSRLYVVAEKYLFSYTSSGLYVLDPLTATVVLWNNEFSDITVARVIDDRIYLMTSDGKFHSLTLFPLDTLILSLYDRKKYRECVETCLAYQAPLKKLLDGTVIDKVVCDIENDLPMLRDDRLLTLLHPLMLLLESGYESSARKLRSGIVVVNCGNSRSKSEENYFRCIAASGRSSRYDECCSRESELTVDSTDESKEETGDANRVAKCCVKEMSETEEEEEELDLNKNVMRKIRIDVRAMRLLVETIGPSMTEEELEKVILDVNWRMNVVRDACESLTDTKRCFVYEILRSAELYYFNALLENALIDLIRLTAYDERVVKQIMVAFISVNTENCGRCTCGNPCPTNESMAEPKFLEVGRSLLKRFVDENKERCINLCNRVPYLWRDYLPIYMEEPRCDAPIDDLLCLCLRIEDTVALSILLPLLDDQRWNLVVTYVKRMYEGRCLFCRESIKNGNNEISIPWTAVIYEIMRKQGSDIATAVLRNLEDAVPNVSIDKSIFQSLVFTKMLHKRGMKRAVNFGRTAAPELSECDTVCSPKVREPLIRVLEKDLGRSIGKNVFGNGAYHWGMRYRNKFSACPCCTLSLRTPVLLGNNGIAIFRCGHAYHVNCMIEKKLTTCDLHS